MAGGGAEKEGVMPFDDKAKQKIWTAVLVALIGALGLSLQAYISKRVEVSEQRERIERLQAQLEQVDGTFEWQWAGDGWRGFVKIEQDASGNRTARVDIKKYCGGAYKGPVMLSSSPGVVTGDVRGFTLMLPVTSYRYDSNCQQTGTGPVILRAKLAPVRAYAGLVEYEVKDGVGTSLGDMVLVGYVSGIRQ